jgi:hypothetical protein
MVGGLLAGDKGGRDEVAITPKRAALIAGLSHEGLLSLGLSLQAPSYARPEPVSRARPGSAAA